MGCNRLGQDYQSQDYWADLARTAADLGITVFDTAEAYEWGGSEEALGLAFGNRTDVHIATKMWAGSARPMPRTTPPTACNRPPRAACAGCAARLSTSTSSTAPVAKTWSATTGPRAWTASKRRARSACAAVAVAVNSVADAIWLIEQGTVDALQFTYNMFNTDAEDRLLALAAEQGVGLLCRLPLAQGILTGKFSPDGAVAEGHRAHLAGDQMQDRIAKTETLRPLGATYDGGLTRLAHHFSLGPQAISAIIPGARTADQLRENVAASNGVGLADDIRQQVDAVRASWAD